MSQSAVLEAVPEIVALPEHEEPYRGESEHSTLSGDFRMHRAFASKLLPLAHDVVVYLPPGYKESDSRHPVLYLQDGQNIFDAVTAFGGNEWHVDETAQEMIAKGEIEPPVIVGIYNAGADRMNEYTPTTDRKRSAGGGGKEYVRFLVEELKPFIDMNYRTRSDRASTAIGGSSLGGLISLYAGLRHADVFGSIAAISPSIWWDRRMILRLARGLKAATGQRIWLDCGTEEGKTTVANCRDLRDILLGKGWIEGETLMYLEAPGSGHDEAAWAARFGAVLGFLFPKR